VARCPAQEERKKQGVSEDCGVSPLGGTLPSTSSATCTIHRRYLPMFEIREFVDDNDQVIRSDVGDLLKEMEAMRAILSKQQEEEEERICED